MRKLIFVLSFGLALNCYAETGDSQQSSSGFFSGMHDVYNKVVGNFTNTETSTDTTAPSQNQSENATMQSALAAMSNDDPKTAINLYTKVLANNPNNKAAMIGLIRAELIAGEYPAARKELDLYKAKFGEDTQYLGEQVRYLVFNDQNEQAQAILTPLLKKDPSNDVLLDLQQFINEHPHGNKIATNTGNPQDTTQTPALNDKDAKINEINNVLVTGKNYNQAKKLLDAYKTQYGEDDKYQTELARYYALTNQPSKSLAIVNPLLEKDPTNSDLQSIKQYAETHHEAPASASGGGKHIPSIAVAASYERRANATKNPADYQQASLAYSQAGDDKKALANINRALDLDPTNPQYLLRRAEIANNVDDQLTVYDTYTALYVTNPNNKKIILGLARASSRVGKTDESTYLYSIYTTRYPHEPTPLIEYAYNESWSGNDRGAVNLLDRYRAIFGATDEYWIARARIISSADRPREALCIVQAMMPKYPDNYDLNYANVTALYYNNQPIEMFQALARLNRLQPGTEETDGLNAFIWTPYRNTVGIDLYDSFDSDTVKISRATLAGTYYLTPKTFLLGNIFAERLSASISSGLNPVEGGHAIKLTGFSAGVNQRINPIIALQGLVGAAHASDGENALTYQGDAFIRATDTLRGDLMIKRAFYDQSARAVSRGVKQNLFQAGVDYQPCLQCYLDFTAAYATFSDNNTERYLEFQPAANIIATERWNIRMGVDGQWQGFSRHAGDGYYDPFNYHYYSFITDIYLKQNDNIGYEFNIGLGTQKDETFTTYAPANDVSGRVYIGIYQDWYLVAMAGASTRGRSIAQNPNIGQYRVYNFDLALTRRLS